MTTAPRKPLTPKQRDARNARRRAQNLANTRYRMARHAASELRSWSDWDDDRPITPEQVITTTTAMYGNYREIKNAPITADEATAALAEVLNR